MNGLLSFHLPAFACSVTEDFGGGVRLGTLSVRHTDRTLRPFENRFEPGRQKLPGFGKSNPAKFVVLWTAEFSANRQTHISAWRQGKIKARNLNVAIGFGFPIVFTPTKLERRQPSLLFGLTQRGLQRPFFELWQAFGQVPIPKRA